MIMTLHHSCIAVLTKSGGNTQVRLTTVAAIKGCTSLLQLRSSDHVYQKIQWRLSMFSSLGTLSLMKKLELVASLLGVQYDVFVKLG